MLAEVYLETWARYVCILFDKIQGNYGGIELIPLRLASLSAFVKLLWLPSPTARFRGGCLQLIVN